MAKSTTKAEKAKAAKKAKGTKGKEVLKPSKKAAKKPGKVTKILIVPKYVKRGEQLTEKQLAKRTDAVGRVRILHKYTLTFLTAPDFMDFLRNEIEACLPGELVPENIDFVVDKAYPKTNELDIAVSFDAVPPKAESDAAKALVNFPANPSSVGDGFKGTTTGRWDCSKPNISATPQERTTTTETPAQNLGADTPIKATCTSDDKETTVLFDAAPWFVQASDDDIATLALEEWGHEDTSDDVAEFCRKDQPKLEELFAYVESLKPIDPAIAGFSVEIDKTQALDWLSKFRPEAYGRALAAEDAVEDDAASEELTD